MLRGGLQYWPIISIKSILKGVWFLLKASEACGFVLKRPLNCSFPHDWICGFYDVKDKQKQAEGV